MTEPIETCANCERKIGRLEQSYDWQGHAVCLECYERLGRASGAGPVAAKAGGTPPVEADEEPGAEDSATDSQAVIWSASPSVIGRLPGYVGLGILAAAALAGAYWAWQIALAAPVILLVIVAQEFVRRSVSYSIVGERLVIQHGIASRSHHEVRIPDIREVTSEQTFFGRIVGVGTVTVDTAAREGAEIRLENVPRPGALVKLLNSLRG
jgi:membrane protein YdbS with pleckstrin-like domain